MDVISSNFIAKLIMECVNHVVEKLKELQFQGKKTLLLHTLLS